MLNVRGIPGDDILESVYRALQFISCYHPRDFVQALAQAYSVEKSPPAKNALAQILVNSRLAAIGRRPMCQDTGAVSVYVQLGQKVVIESDSSLEELVNAGVRRAYLDESNPLRASIVNDPLGLRRNTGDNTPATIHVRLVPGDKLRVSVVAKGGGSENKVRFTVLNPSDSVSDWVVNTVAGLGAGWCPPGIISIGVGGSAEKSMILAKEALLEPVNIGDLRKRGASTAEEKLRLELYDRINDLGIGAQGLGGLTTVVDVKVASCPTHAASLPIALVPQCAANRHVSFELDGTGPYEFTPPLISDWPEVVLATSSNASRKLDLNNLSPELLQSFSAGETVLLSGRLLTARDAAHKRMQDMLKNGIALPVSLEGRTIYYVGPVEPVGDEVVGPAGPTTANRMDPFTDMILNQGAKLLIGKAERGPETIELLVKHKALYLIAVGGAAIVVSKAIRSSRIVAFEDLGMEAMREFTVEDMPVIVAVDFKGKSAHTTGPLLWRGRGGAIA